MGYSQIDANGDFTDVEVEFDTTGSVTGYVAGGLSVEIDTTSPGCDAAAAAHGLAKQSGHSGDGFRYIDLIAIYCSRLIRET